MPFNPDKLTTLGALKAAGYRTQSVKDELRANLIAALKSGRRVFPGILGYDETVIPELQTALLSRHNILLLGLRGQAKTRIARQLTELLDEYIPTIAGSEINDDPLQPISRYARDLVAQAGDDTPIGWLHRTDRYTEKLATPDVSVADLIGDLDPIKAATQKLTYADERTLHFGLVPRAHRGIFVINELPDLQARIQVALFNILQEEDIQVRGFKLRLPLDIQFVFTANPEDYTNRGAIVTPLKDRIESQILTHYPKDLATGQAITQQEAHLAEAQRAAVHVDPLVQELVEQIAFEARHSEYVDPKSGVSARLTISAYENLVSAAERRMLLAGETKTAVRLTDLYGAVPSVTGKVELVYEGEQEGAHKVAQSLISLAIKTQFARYFPDPEKLKRSKKDSPYEAVVGWFNAGNTVDLTRQQNERAYEKTLKSVPGLEKLLDGLQPGKKGTERLLWLEFLLHGMAEYSLLSKHRLEIGLQFKDMLGSLFNPSALADDEDDEDADSRPSRYR